MLANINENDPQVKQASMQHIMMVQQRYPNLLPLLVRINHTRLLVFPTKQHHFVGVLDLVKIVNCLDHFWMVMLRSFTSGYKPRAFGSHVRFILKVDSCCAIFVIDINAPMCILVGKCPTNGGFLTIYFGWMATY